MWFFNSPEVLEYLIFFLIICLKRFGFRNWNEVITYRTWIGVADYAVTSLEIVWSLVITTPFSG